ncbi:hypothetical protein VYU27_008597 [Nannochloropsis oceanica]
MAAHNHRSNKARNTSINDSSSNNSMCNSNSKIPGRGPQQQQQWSWKGTDVGLRRVCNNERASYRTCPS